MVKFKTRKKDGQVFPVEEHGGSAEGMEFRTITVKDGDPADFADAQVKGVPEYQSDKWNKEKDHVEKQFDRTFNQITFSNVQTIEPNWFDYIDYKEITNKDLKDNGYNIEEMSEDDIEDAKQELQNEQAEIIWGWVFEARNDHVAGKIMDNKEKIQELGLSIIDMRNSDNADKYDTAVFLGVRSAGHDFYEQYWVPLWHIFDWV